jgi:hypothetical protein
MARRPVEITPDRPERDLHDRDTKYTSGLTGPDAMIARKDWVLPASQPQPECLRGALGQVGEGGVLV